MKDPRHTIQGRILTYIHNNAKTPAEGKFAVQIAAGIGGNHSLKTLFNELGFLYNTNRIDRKRIGKRYSFWACTDS